MGFIFFVKKFVVNFFCRSAEPLYFSLVRMLSIVVACHFSLPPGVDTVPCEAGSYRICGLTLYE